MERYVPCIISRFLLIYIVSRQSSTCIGRFLYLTTNIHILDCTNIVPVSSSSFGTISSGLMVHHVFINQIYKHYATVIISRFCLCMKPNTLHSNCLLNFSDPEISSTCNIIRQYNPKKEVIMEKKITP